MSLKKTLIFVIFLFSSWGGLRLYFSLTDGFFFSQISPRSYQLQETTFSPHYNPEEMLEIRHHLNQPYKYLGKGAQIYAFLSEDGKYVLKIFKQKHLSFSFLEEWVYSLPGMENLREKRIAKHKSRWSFLISSIALAQEELKDETRLVYIHFRPTIGVLPQALLYDKLGFSYLVDLDHNLFFLQEYTVTLAHALSTWDEAKIKTGLSNLIDALLERSKKGVQELDHKILDNIGFIGTKPVLVDVGNFVARNDLQDPAVYIPILHHDVKPLIEFLEKYHPSLAIWFKKELQNKIAANQNK
jgi:hypothetical protein